MGLGLGHQPVWQGRRNIGVFLHRATGEETGNLEEELGGGKGQRTPLRMSKMSRMATQNSSKSRFPSLSTSARSQTRSSWASPRPLFFSTGAACSPVR